MDSSSQPFSTATEAETRANAGASVVNGLRVRPDGKRRKVFFLLDSFNVGGTETQAVELAIRLDAERYDVTLGCLRARGPLLEKLAGSSVSVREFHPKGGFDSINGIYQLFRLAIFLRRGEFQIVHTHDLYSNMMGIPAALLARVPVIISSRRDLGHLDWYQTGRRVWMRRLQNLSTVVLTNASAIREALVAEDNFRPEKVRVIHNGVDLDRFRNGSRDRNWLMPGGEHEKWIALVGSMYSDVKGHPTLIAAASAVLHEFPQVRFILVGEGTERKEFEGKVAELGIAERFSFLGLRSDVPRLLAGCDLAVLPSKAEGLPNAVLEYLAAGLPTIASRVGGNAEIIQDGVTGLLIPPQDSSALSAALLRLLRDDELSSKLGRNGREYVTEHFSFQRMVENTEQLYTDLLRSRVVNDKTISLPEENN